MSRKDKPRHHHLQQTNNRTEVIMQSQFIGPIPLPAHLEHYEKILPGAAERILAMAERQSAHRQKIEDKVITSDVKNSSRGLTYGFIICLVAIVGGFTLIYLGKSIEGSVIGGTALVGLVTAFIYGSNQRRKERESKKQ
jgi:uncharacterized membrane protein